MTATDAILALLAVRRDGATICPSEAARLLDPEAWRTRMDEVRAAAAELMASGLVTVTQRGMPVPPDARGPIRYRLAEARSEPKGD